MERTGLMLKVEEKIGEDVKDYLRREYVVNQRTSPEIAEEIGIGSSSVIYWLKGFELPIRTKSEAQALAKTPGRFKSPELQRVEQSLGESIEVFLRREYLENKRPATIIAEECGVHSATLYTWMKNYKIPIRDKSEAQSLAKLSEGVRKPSKSQLEKWYLEEGQSTNNIGEEVGVVGETIGRWLGEYGIPIRNFSQAQLPKGVTRPSKEELEQWYVDEKRSANEIAEEVGVTPNTVITWMEEHNILRRSNSQAQLIRTGKNPTKPPKEELERMYVGERKGTGDIAKKIGVTPRTVMNWMIDYKIPIRGVQESKLPEGVREPSREELERMYVREGRSTVKIAKKIGVKSSSTVGRWLKKHGISREKHSKEKLNRLYNEERLNAIEIGERLEISSAKVYYWMEKYEIPRRDFSDSKLPKGITKPSKEELEKMLENESIISVARSLDIDKNTIGNWIREYGISRNEEERLESLLVKYVGGRE